MSASDCLFCKILAGDVAAELVYESNEAIAFRDINPQASSHVLIIPRQHIETINDLGPGDAALIGNLFLVAQQVAKDEGIAENGYRVVMNCNSDAGQTVFHIHLHMLGGRRLNWPPG